MYSHLPDASVEQFVSGNEITIEKFKKPLTIRALKINLLLEGDYLKVR
jgi:hypothetical protein